MKRNSMIRMWVKVAACVCGLACMATLGSCRKNIGMTTVHVPDSVRHYYPILTGEILNLSFLLENTGDQPLIIRDIQTSCGCIVPELDTHMLLPGKQVRLLFKYESAKNIGYVDHTIRIYGNIKPNGVYKLKFDTNVVTHADYTRDYEELYKEEVERSNIIRGLVDGDESEKGYWTDDISHDSRSQKQYFWRKEGGD